ncbi:hypothetical protein C8E04_2810 [Rhodococcus globerulus]|nr:hypothetical protein C8E04_2810 [Rhodococcus globerulus]
MAGVRTVPALIPTPYVLRRCPVTVESDGHRAVSFYRHLVSGESQVIFSVVARRHCPIADGSPTASTEQFNAR